jgi:hypothetical protein
MLYCFADVLGYRSSISSHFKVLPVLGYPSNEARDIHLAKQGMLMKEGVFRREGI